MQKLLLGCTANEAGTVERCHTSEYTDGGYIGQSAGLWLIGQSVKSMLFALEDPMKLETNIRPISYIKTHAAEMLQQINDTQNPIVITQNGLARGVLLDTRTYQEMIDAIGILKLLAQGEHDVESGATVSHEDAINAAMQAIDER